MSRQDRLLDQIIEASGLTALCIIEGNGGYTIKVGRAAAENIPAPQLFWTAKGAAADVARRARRWVADVVDLNDVRLALQRSAAEDGVTIASHTAMIKHASELSRRLDATLGAKGHLSDFNAAYSYRRELALQRGTGFMSYGTALARLRKCLIPRLMSGGALTAGRTLFEEVLGPLPQAEPAT